MTAVFVAACSSSAPRATPEPAPAPPKPTTPACDAFFASPGLQQKLALLDKLASVAPPWSDYRPESHPLILLGPDRPAAATCALVWRGGHELARLALAEPVELQMPYGFWTSDPIGPHPVPVMKLLAATMMLPVPQTLASQLEAIGVTRGFLLRVDIDPAPFVKLGLSDYVDVFWFLWTVHESFHLYSQFPTWLDQPARYRWPEWDRQPRRPEIVANCYGGKDAPLVAGEQAALGEAFAAAYRRNDPPAACAAARRFLVARMARYAALDAARVATADVPIGCEHAEAIMELEEGTASYIADVFALELGVMSVDQIEAGFQHPPPVVEPFYGYGAFQLLVLRRLVDREALRAATERIATSIDYHGSISGELARAVSTCSAK